MEIDNVITLKSGKKYLLLLESELDLNSYFLAVQLDEHEEPTNNYVVFQEIEKDGKSFAQKISDTFILNQLLEDYDLQYKEKYDDAA